MLMTACRKVIRPPTSKLEPKRHSSGYIRATSLMCLRPCLKCGKSKKPSANIPIIVAYAVPRLIGRDIALTYTNRTHRKFSFASLRYWTLW